MAKDTLPDGAGNDATFMTRGDGTIPHRSDDDSLHGSPPHLAIVVPTPHVGMWGRLY